MEGFLDNEPLLVKVDWTDSEVELLAGTPLPYGLRAETRGDNNTVVRWMVPWSSVSYIRQVQPAPEQGEEPGQG